MAIQRTAAFLIVSALAIPSAAGVLVGVLRYQSGQMRRAFEADARVATPSVNHVVDAVAHETVGGARPIDAGDESLPAVAVLGDSWMAGEPVDPGAEDSHLAPAHFIARGLSQALDSPVRVRSLAEPSAQAEAVIRQVSELLRDQRMRRSRSGRHAPRYAVISMGSADIVYPLGGSLTLPILTRAVNRLQSEGGYRVIVLTCPNLGLLPGVRNPLRTVLRRSSRVLSGSQWVTAVSSSALPLSMNESLRGTTDVGLISAAARFPSPLGYRQLAAVVLARILDDIPAQITVTATPDADIAAETGGSE